MATWNPIVPNPHDLLHLFATLITTIPPVSIPENLISQKTQIKFKKDEFQKRRKTWKLPKPRKSKKLQNPHNWIPKTQKTQNEMKQINPTKHLELPLVLTPLLYLEEEEGEIWDPEKGRDRNQERERGGGEERDRADKTMGTEAPRPNSWLERRRR